MKHISESMIGWLERKKFTKSQLKKIKKGWRTATCGYCGEEVTFSAK